MARKFHVESVDIDCDESELPFGLHTEPGWFGHFSRWQHEGALLNGMRIRKVKNDPTDTTKIGELGTILGSVVIPGVAGIVYFLEWDHTPKTAVSCADWKIAPI